MKTYFILGVALAGFATALLTAQTRKRAGHAACRHHAGRVSGVPPGARRLPRGRSQRRRARTRLQRHELRRLPQHPHDRRRRDDGRAASRAPERERRVRDARRLRRHALSHVLGPRPRVSAGAASRHERLRAARADSALRSRACRGHPRSDAAGARGSARSQRRRRQRTRRRSSSTSKPASAAWDGSGGRRSMPRSLPSAPTRIATRWESPTTCSRRKARSAITPEQMRLCDPFSDPEDIRDPRTRRRGIDNFASFMRFLAPAGRGRRSTIRFGQASRSSPPSAARLPYPNPRDRTERQSALPSEDSGVVFRPSPA